MKNTTFRKKALLSSIAMLLVALVALGSATFAWFTANPNADASGISMKTTASTGLVIRTDSDTEWSHNAKLYNGQTEAFNLDPVSQNQAASKAAEFWTVAAAASNKYAADPDEQMDDVNVGGYNGTNSFSKGAVYAEKVYFRLSDGSDVTASASKKVQLSGVSIKKNASATMENAIRVAIADSNGSVLATYALSTAGLANDDGSLRNPIVTASKTESAWVNLETVGTKSLDLGLSGLSADGSDTKKFVTVYVYLDGQDSNCNSDQVGQANADEIIESITLNFELV